MAKPRTPAKQSTKRPPIAKVEPDTDRLIVAELRALRSELAAMREATERHQIAGVRGIAMIERHVRTYMQALLNADDDEHEHEHKANGKAGASG